MVVCLIVCGFFQGVCLAAAPTDSISRMLQEVLSIQSDTRLQGEESKATRRAAIKEIIAKNFDLNKMAERALDPHWKRLSNKESTEFRDLFKELFQNSYTRLVSDFLKQEKILYTNEDIRQGEATVKTVMVRPQEEISVDYLLVEISKEKWLVVDVKIDGVSVVGNYQRSFTRVIDRESFQGLLEKLRLQQKSQDNGT